MAKPQASTAAPKAAVLEPCPFCRGKAQLELGRASFHDAIIVCTVCCAEGPTFDVDDGQPDERGRNSADAVAAWNTRPAAEAPPSIGGREAYLTQRMAERGEGFEGLRDALNEVMTWIRNWSPSFTEDNEWAETKDKVEKALQHGG